LSIIFGKGRFVSVDLIVRLEELVDRLLSERAELSRRNRELTAELDRLRADRERACVELGAIITKLDRLEGHGT
jgi:ABC-type phosphate transport system auxiliary subunit